MEIKLVSITSSLRLMHSSFAFKVAQLVLSYSQGYRPAVYSTVSITTTRAIFSITDFPGIPDDKEWNGLKLNSKCWPSGLAPDDPGWVLLTNDEFYSAAQHPELAAHTSSYTTLPSYDSVLKALGGKKSLFSTLDVPEDVYTAKGAKIPSMLFGKLPGLPDVAPAGQDFDPSVPAPPPAAPPHARAVGRNNTSPWVQTDLDQSNDLVDEDDYDVDDSSSLDPRHEDDLPEWWSEYLELLEEYGPPRLSGTRPIETDAKATPAWRAGPTATPAIEGSVADVRQAKHTGTPWSG
jgi:hypothetical protein